MPIKLPDLNHALCQPEVIAAIDFGIETVPRETQVDRSYASIGFVAHRENSIARRNFIDRGFDLPLKLYKRTQQHQKQKGFQIGGGFSHGPTGTATFSSNRTKGTTLEAADTKVMPTCHVEHENGDKSKKNDPESYSSYNVVYYQDQDPPLTTDPPEDHPFEVRVAMGINLRPAGSEHPLPQISFVHRNQVLIWVSDPALKAQIHGILVLTTSFLDDITTKNRLDIYEDAEIELGSLNAPQVDPEEHELERISLSIAQVQKPAASSNKLRASFRTVRKNSGRMKQSQEFPNCHRTDISPHQYLVRGWDANRHDWRKVLWPALDSDFRAAKKFGAGSPVWKIKCPWKVTQTTTGTNATP
ncbi:hypothetical protein K438DRAFT_510056 [Mycena galopus ATCC 62051]|nr:hypothetical protein K438DRAFT_510056 [Mycena galopus ATCC 62051]